MAEDETGTEQGNDSETQVNTDLEGRARRMGWRPKEEFRGDPNRWTDAKTFIERGETELPVLRERYRALDDRFERMQTAFDTQRGELSKVSAAASEMREVLDEFRTRAGRAEEISYARAKADYEARMAIAVEQADKAGYDRAKAEWDRINALERDNARPPERKPAATTEPKPDPKPAETVAIDPTIAKWVSENPWFESDKGMAGYATAVFQQFRAERPGLSAREHLDDVRREVVERFPDKFENRKRATAPAVSAPSAPVTPKKGGIPPFEQWPADAKVAYERAKKWMPNYSKEEYGKMYFAGGE